MKVLNSRFRSWRIQAKFLAFVALLLTFFVLPLNALVQEPTATARDRGLRTVRNTYPSEWGVPNRAGLTYSANLNQFFLLKKGPPGADATRGSTIVVLSPYEELIDTLQIEFTIDDFTNVAFDDGGNRLLLINEKPAAALQIRMGGNGKLDPTTLTRFDLAALALKSVDGIDVDAQRGVLLLLDHKARQVVQVALTSSGLDPTTSTKISLVALGNAKLRGLAVNPINHHLYTASKAQGKLFELTETGQLVATYDLATLNLVAPRDMVFAPSPDLTDPANTMRLFVLDSKQATDQVVGAGETAASELRNQLYLPMIAQPTVADKTLTAATGAADHEVVSEEANANPAAVAAQRNGAIVEIDLDAPGQQVSAASVNVTPLSLIQTVNTASFSPPSPDPSGLTYLPASNTLLVVDGEVEETVTGITHFAGANTWEMTLGGSVVRSANISKIAPTVVPMSNEPTGIVRNVNNGHFYVTDDDAREVYDLNPGVDGLIGTSDDTWTSFDTAQYQSMDPEGIAYDSVNDRLFVADGVNIEIYQYTLAGALVGQFDVAALGVLDPESVEYNPDSGTLLILSNAGSPIVIETTTSGVLLRTMDVSAANAVAPAGLAYAPASNGSGAKRYYIVDRATDNDFDPNAVDGKLFEMTAPAPLSGSNAPPTVNAGPDQSITLPSAGTLDGTVSDDGLPVPPGTLVTTWSQTSGPGLVTFANANAVDTTANFSIPGVYVLRLSAYDGEITVFDEVAFTVTGTNGVTAVNIAVAVGSDDAEERASNNSTSLTSTDLDFMLDSGSTPVTLLAVGMRFTGIAVPQGATIVNAYVQFRVDEANSEATQLTIQGQAADNAATFVNTSRNISNRVRTSAAVTWSPESWLTVGQAGMAQRTPNLAAVIQEIVNRPGWASNNALAIIVTGSGQRVAKAFEAGASAAPVLHVEWSAAPVNQAPLVTISQPQNLTTANQGDSASFGGSATDIQDGNLTAGLVWTSNLDGVIGTGGTFNKTSLSAGIHTITARATDSGGLLGEASATMTVFAPAPVLLAAGDNADCAVTSDDAVATLLNGMAGTILTLGDNVYEDGTATEFANCYSPTWGRHKARTRPVPGNHEYHIAGAADYFNYFGASAGDPTKGYYSFDLSGWHIIALNSEIAVNAGSPQEQWLRADLAANPTTCTLAYWHRPRFSSGALHGSSSSMAALWQALYDYRADIVLNGHEHHYERFGLQNPSALADPARGIREFVVGTGGALGSSYTFGPPLANSEVRQNNIFGVLKLTLRPTSYDWAFVSISGQTFTDTGSGSCVASPASTATPTNTPVPPTATNTPVPSSNTAPMVSAGSDQTITLLAGAALDGTVTDDGLPAPSSLAATWSQVSGPGTVTFGNASAVDTTAAFSQAGTYTLRLTASDGALSSSDELIVTVTGSGGVTTVEVRVAAGSDDAEESNVGSVALTSGDLELVFDGNNQTVGLRFTSLVIPPGVAIVNAYLQFKADEVQSEPTTLLIQGQAADNAATFASTGQNISARARTAVGVPWSPAAWSTVGQASANQRTPNIASVIQEIVNRPAWVSGNALALLITGTGHRTAETFEGDAAGAPLLHVEYSTNPSNMAPVVSISTPSNGAIFSPGDAISFTGNGNDAQDGDVTAGLTWRSNLDGVIGTGGSFVRSNLSGGVHTITASAADSGGLLGATQIGLTINQPDLIFADGFESGNLVAWSASTTDGGNLSVSPVAALVGSNGMQALINDNNAIYVTDNSPSLEPRYRGRFYFDPNTMPMANGNAHYLFYGLSGASTVVLRVEFRFSSSAYQLRAALLNDATTWANSSWFVISDAPHVVEIDWQAASAAGANNGSLVLWIDNVQRANLTNIDNDTRRIDQIRLGAVASVDVGTRGIYYFDAFESHRQSLIGPAAFAGLATPDGQSTDSSAVEQNEATFEEEQPTVETDSEQLQRIYLSLIRR